VGLEGIAMSKGQEGLTRYASEAISTGSDIHLPGAGLMMLSIFISQNFYVEMKGFAYHHNILASS